MGIRVAIIGYGAVASIHARQLAGEHDVSLVSVFEPNRERSQAFAASYGIERVAETLAEAVSAADVAIICSPSALHYEQAKESVQRGVHTLVEIPPCETPEEAEDLEKCAQNSSVRIGCSHTSRYVAPFQQIGAAIRSGVLGQIFEVNYVRHHQLIARNWTDNALMHHAAHPMDLAISWFGGIIPKACVALPPVLDTHTVSLLGKLPRGAPFAISITYFSKMPHTRMLIVGEDHTVETDGFTYIRSDLESLALQTVFQETYERAIHDQDMAFIRACLGGGSYPPWSEAVELMQTVNRFRTLGFPEDANE